MRAIFLGAAFALLVTQPSPGACLYLGHIYNWTLLNHKTLVVEDDFHKKFRLSISGTCTNPAPQLGLRFKSMEGMRLSCISRGDEIVGRNFGGGASVCVIDKVEPYGP